VAHPTAPDMAHPVCVYIEGISFLLSFSSFFIKRTTPWAPKSGKTRRLFCESGRSRKKIVLSTRRILGPVSFGGSDRLT
jgi:hypothetical protein